MATFNFTTGGNAKGKIDHSVTRSSTGYTVSYKVYLARTTAYKTHGNIGYTVYVNNSTSTSGTKEFTITSDKKWCLLVEGSEWVSVSNKFDTASYTVGIECTDKSGANINAYKISKQTSEANSVSAYATHTKASSIEIIDTGKNTFKIKSTTGGNGTNNSATGCHIYYNMGKSKTDKDDPHWTTTTNYFFDGSVDHSGVKAGATKTSGEISLDTSKVSSGDTVTVKAVPYTLPDAVKGSVIDKAIKYYSPPSIPSLQLSVNTDKPTPKSVYTLSWDEPTQNSTHSPPLKKYSLAIYYNDEQMIINNEFDTDDNAYVNKNSSTNKFDLDVLNYLRSEGVTLRLKKGDTLYCTLAPSSQWGNKDTHWGTMVTSNKCNLGSSASMYVKVNNEWKEGNVWVKVNGQWVEATGVWAKVDGVWKESK